MSVHFERVGGQHPSVEDGLGEAVLLRAILRQVVLTEDALKSADGVTAVRSGSGHVEKRTLGDIGPCLENLSPAVAANCT